MEISEVIKAIRSQLQMSQTDFAEAVHVSFSTVNRWENNKVVPNRMAKALIVNLCEKKNISNELIEEMRAFK